MLKVNLLPYALPTLALTTELNLNQAAIYSRALFVLEENLLIVKINLPFLLIRQ